MIGFKSPRHEQAYREKTEQISSVGSMYRTCSRCGFRFHVRDLKRASQVNTRFSPTRWVCKGGCNAC